MPSRLLPLLPALIAAQLTAPPVWSQTCPGDCSGDRLVTMGIGGLSCWDDRSGKQLWAAEPAERLQPEFARFSPDGRLLAVLLREPRQGSWYAILDVATGKPAEGVTPPPSSPFDVPAFRAFTRDSRSALVQTQKGVSEWDLIEAKVGPVVKPVKPLWRVRDRRTVEAAIEVHILAG